MQFNSILLSVFGLFLAVVGNSQSAVRGVIYDTETGETIPFADVVVQGTTNGTTSDLDGAYHLPLDPGTYTLVYSYLGYSDLVVNDVIVKKGEVNVFNVKIGEDTEQLAEVVVTAKQVRNTEAAVLTLQKKSVSFIDGLSAQTFSKTGDGDAAAAIKRVPGVSVENGKHVYVRGLGDRYTKTILNGMDIPGLDPDKNTVQMDIFPTNIIDNLIVYKTFTPNLPGDFTGGMVEIVTKDFPDQPTANLSISLGYNPQVHFQDDFTTYTGGKLDWFGMDDGTRELPIDKNTTIPDPVMDDPALTTITSQFNPEMATSNKSQFLDRSLSFSTGNQYNKSNHTIGYNAAINYSGSFSFDEHAEFSTYWKSPDKSKTELDRESQATGPLSTESHLWSGLVGGAIKFDRHKFSVSVLRSQSGESRAAKFHQTSSEDNPAELFVDVLEYSERNVTNFLVSGKHSFADDKLSINWRFSPTFSRINEPDIRYTAYELTDQGDFELNPSVGAVSTRTWRNLKEDNYSGKIDATYEFQGIRDLSSKLKAGVITTAKSRSYEILNYNIRTENQPGMSLTGDANEILRPDNVWTPESQTGSYMIGNFEPANSYEADQLILGAYAMTELPLTPQLKAILGVRLEKAMIDFTGQNNSGSQVMNNERVFDETDFLPSAALIYAIKENMNLRFSYTQTLARPTFKEKSLVQINDRISNRTFIGNIDLEESHITNYDARWEYFFDRGQVISISGFYKSFNNPIELVVYDEANPDNFTPRNVGDAEVFGVEIEGRKSLDFISLPNFSFVANVALISSNVTMDDTERQSRIDNARDGEEVGTTRDMFGQSPYIVNVGFNYQNFDHGWDGNISFNVQGERLSLVGIGRNADVYEQPFESLNLKVSKKIGSKLKLSFSAENILNSDKLFLYKSYEATERTFQKFSPGSTYSFGVSVNLK